MHVHTLDLNFRGLPEVIAAYLVESDGELVLIETGPSTCLAALDEEIRRVGHDPLGIRKVAVTHIHLDHAGAAGHWAARGAQILVHERGARHLADPSKLIAGAQAVYGDAMETLWGDMLPVPEAQLVPLREGDSWNTGSTRFEVWDTPGHARHHLAFLAEGQAFTGDTAGVRLPSCKYLSPATAPSQFDAEALLLSLARLRAARLSRIYLTHFGPLDFVEEHLDRYAEVIRGIAALATELLPSGVTPVAFAEAFTTHLLAQARRDGLSETDWERYQSANDSTMCADGVRGWWESLSSPRAASATG
jgi:glyoxylase-like metal-dependent hydrolase (beta-lactamase superfamily II)